MTVCLETTDLEHVVDIAPEDMHFHPSKGLECCGEHCPCRFRCLLYPELSRVECDDCIEDEDDCHCDDGNVCHHRSCQEEQQADYRRHAWMGSMTTAPVGVAEEPANFDHTRALFLDGECD